MLRLKLLYVVSTCVLAATSVLAGFGVTTSGNSLIVDTNAGLLVFTINKSNGDITSMKFNGIGAQDQGSKKSHISSGIGATCTAEKTGNAGNYIKVTCATSTLTQYYVAQYNTPAIYMATFITSEPTIGELRFIARLSKSTLPNSFTVSAIAGGTAIEGSDIFNVGGQTRSKFYSSKQFIDDKIHGVTGNGIGAFMIIPGNSYESASGGPFFRDINNQGGNQQELYFYMNSGHTQTEAFRTGLHGPYALWFTTGAAPSADLDPLFWESPNINGFVGKSSRGRVTGKASGIPSAFSSLQVLGFSNSVAQYWARTDSSGSFTSPYMKPGTYIMTLYKAELAVKTQSVTVTAGGFVTSNIASAEASPSVIWQLGEFDGTPRGFRNADKIETMNPSDSRMSSWGPATFTVGSSNINTLPMAVFKNVGDLTLQFALSSSQLGAHTLEIGTTNAFAGGRPQVTVNSFKGPSPAAPSQPNSRGVTRGTWRGNNIRYAVNIPSGVLTTGVNTITISVLSGSSGDGFLSPSFILDAIRLY